MDRPNANQPPGGMDRRSDAERMAEAANRPLDFQPKERAKYVRDSIVLVESYQQQGLTTDEIKEKVPTFVRDYKNLFEMVTQPGGYNKQSLKTMLVMLDRMGTGELSQHQASVIVGQRLADTYIKPSVEGKN
jgi:hypothetical protein